MENVIEGLWILVNLAVRDGIGANYRKSFWRLFGSLLARGRIEDALHVGLVAHHLIAFARAAEEGQQNASFYSATSRRVTARMEGTE